jgi:hypothetical protein
VTSQIEQLLREALLRERAAELRHEVELRRGLALLQRGPLHPVLVEYVIAFERLLRQRNAAVRALDALAPVRAGQMRG